MKLWLLNFEKWDYEEYIGFVVSAENIESAELICRREYSGESWDNSFHIEEIGTHNKDEERVIFMSQESG